MLSLGHRYRARRSRTLVTAVLCQESLSSLSMSATRRQRISGSVTRSSWRSRTKMISKWTFRSLVSFSLVQKVPVSKSPSSCGSSRLSQAELDHRRHQTRGCRSTNTPLPLCSMRSRSAYSVLAKHSTRPSSSKALVQTGTAISTSQSGRHLRRRWRTTQRNPPRRNRTIPSRFRVSLPYSAASLLTCILGRAVRTMPCTWRTERTFGTERETRAFRGN